MNNIAIKTEYEMQNTCLACMKVDNNLLPMFESNLKDMFIVLTNIEISQNDNLPFNLCMKCAETVNSYYSFREDCIKSYNALKETQIIKFEICPDNQIDIPSEGDADMEHYELIQYEPVITLSCTDAKDILLTESTSLQCTLCVKTFKSKNKLNKHIKQHIDGKRFICDQCGREFKNSANLWAHMRIHAGTKRYHCDECSKSFMGYNNLKQHLRIHSGEKPFTCEYCGKAFTEQGTLTRHLRIHTGDKPYSCHLCGRTFNSTSSVARHIRLHAGIRPFHCEICGKDFSCSHHLKTHVRTHSRALLSNVINSLKKKERL